jgi:2-amino-4-hydroxy-6-hydroxymethyldihydropteridine diphosphokinase
MNKAVILLGTNKGERSTNVAVALRFIEENCGSITRFSSIYETAPWGKTDQSSFLNQVIEINTTLTSRQLLDQLLSIETNMGRTRKEKWEPRLIDLDILFFNSEVHKEVGLTIPHPHLHERRFTLVPLNEILSDFRHPVFALTVKELLEQLSDNSSVTLFEKHQPKINLSA